MNIARGGTIRDHDDLCGKQSGLHKHQQSMQKKRQGDVLDVVAVDVVQRGLEEVLLGSDRGPLGAAGCKVSRVLGERIVLAAHPHLGPGHEVRLGKQRDGGEEKQA